jgi:uncharacterized membrane protein
MDAKIRYESSIQVDAPVATVWAVQTDFGGWPGWQPSVSSAQRLDAGELRAGSQFRWTQPVPAMGLTLVITSTIDAVDPGRLIRWSGPAEGEGLRVDNGIHEWTFSAVDGGTLVHTEEAWFGDQVEADPATATQLLGASLEEWLRNLKAAAEARQ